MRRILSGLAMIVISAPAAAGLDSISNTDAVSGLKQALNDGSIAAVAKLGVQNGFLGNPKVKIPLPPSIQRAEGAMRAVGMGKQADDLVHSMNRAAETAVIEARPLLVDAVKKMSVQDAKKILTGGDTAATDYFKRNTQKPLAKRFLPIVKRATDCPVCVREMPELARTYEKFRARGVELVAVAMRHDPPNYVIRFAEANRLPFKVALDPLGEHAKTFGGVRLTPTTFVIDRRGNIAERIVGRADFSQLNALIESKLKD